eukprot:g20783.t1
MSWEVKQLQRVSVRACKPLSVQDMKPRVVHRRNRRFDCFHALRRPGGRFKAWWDSLGMILLAYDLIAVPLRVFDIGESFFLTVMFWIAHFYWNVSIPLSFITGYDDSGVLVMELRNTIQKYARGWFFFDLALVSFDWAIIAANVWSSATVGFPRSLRFLGLLRLGRVVRVGSAMQLIQEQFGSRMASMQYSVLKIVVQLVISTHIIACLWFLIGSEDHPDSTWVDQLQLKGKTPSLQYATSLHWACVQLGVGQSEIEAEDVAGVTLLALGNGMPDVMTACSSVNKANDLALTMGEFLGAANFIIVFVFACVLLASPGATSVDAWPFLRDSSMYLLVVFFMVFVTWDGQISLVESLAFFALYGVYLLVVLLPSRLSPRTSSTEDIELEEPNSPSDSFQPLASESEAEDVGGLQVSEPMALAGLQAKGNLSLVLTTMELPFTLARRLGSQTSEDLAYNTPSKMMHNTVSCLTKYLQDAVLGITVLAWGNSVGDLVADTALVRQRRSKMAVAGIYGSPLLSDLLGLGIALTSHTWQHGDLRSQLSKQNRIAAVSLLLAVVMTMAVFFWVTMPSSWYSQWLVNWASSQTCPEGVTRLDRGPTAVAQVPVEFVDGLDDMKLPKIRSRVGQEFVTEPETREEASDEEEDFPYKEWVSTLGRRTLMGPCRSKKQQQVSRGLMEKERLQKQRWQE